MRRRSLLLAAPALILPRRVIAGQWPRVTGPAHVASSTVAWSAVNKPTEVTLSNSDLTATGTFSTNNFANGLGANAISGNIVFDIVANVVENNNSFSAGIGNASMSTADGNYLGIDTDSVGFIADGRVIINNSTFVTLAGYTDGDVVEFAVRFANNTIWRRINSGDWNDDPTADPSTNTNGITLGVSSTLFAAYTAFFDGGSSQISLRTTPFNTLPSGFSYVS